jgi:transcriptional regulator with XRE-family HTH domain
MKAKPHLLPRHARMMSGMGGHLRLARLRRRLGTELLAERAGISRATLNKIERGDPSVAMGNYFAVMNALGLADAFASLGADDPLGRIIQDDQLPLRIRKSNSSP